MRFKTDVKIEFLHDVLYAFYEPEIIKIFFASRILIEYIRL